MRSGHSVYSTSTSQYGGSVGDHDSRYYGGGGSELGSSISKASGGADARRTASRSAKTRAPRLPLPRGGRVQGNGDLGDGLPREMGDGEELAPGGNNRHGGTTNRRGGHSSSHSSSGRSRRKSRTESDPTAGGHHHHHGDVSSPSAARLLNNGPRNNHLRAARRTAGGGVDGSVSDIGVGSGGRNNPASSSSRNLLRTMSLRGRSFFFAGGSGNAGLGERRSVSMSSLRGRGDSARNGGGGGGGVAHRVCSALSVSWLFSRKSSKRGSAAAAAGTPSGLRKRRGRRSKGGGTSGGRGGGGSRRTTAFSGAGVIGIVGGEGLSSSSDEADYDGDVFEIGGPLDIAVGGGTGRRSGAGAGDSRIDSGGGAVSLPGGYAGSPGSSSLGTGASGSQTMSFTRSGLLGFNRNARR